MRKFSFPDSKSKIERAEVRQRSPPPHVIKMDPSDPTVTQSLLTGQSLVFRRETTTSDDLILFNNR